MSLVVKEDKQIPRDCDSQDLVLWNTHACTHFSLCLSVMTTIDINAILPL